jgi:hypothetical protein
VEMIELDIAMGNDLITRTHDLAKRYFGDDGDESLARVLEIAFAMRSLWSYSITRGQQEASEAVSTWEFPDSATNRESNAGIQNWLFRR